MALRVNIGIIAAFSIAAFVIGVQRQESTIEYSLVDYLLALIGAIFIPAIAVYWSSFTGYDPIFLPADLSAFSLNPAQPFRFGFFVGLLFLCTGTIGSVSEVILAWFRGLDVEWIFGPFVVAGAGLLIGVRFWSSKYVKQASRKDT